MLLDSVTWRNGRKMGSTEHTGEEEASLVKAGYTMGAKSAQPPHMPALQNPRLTCKPARPRTDSRVLRGDI